MYRLTLACVLTLFSCGEQAAPQSSPTPSDEAPPAEAPPKNIILVVGDGMGTAQIALLEEYARRAPSQPFGDRPTAFRRLANEGEVGLSMTSPVDALVVDSACSATQLATGLAARNEVVGVAPDGARAQTVLELAEERGMATGLVSDTRATHATPAAFAAHRGHRRQENGIAEDMLESGVDVLFSGGLRYWVPKSIAEPASEAGSRLRERLSGAFAPTTKREDERDLLSEAEDKGYHLVFDRRSMAEVERPTIGLFAASGMSDAFYEAAHRDDESRREPTLREMSLRAIELLDNEDGFFLMIESGQIDWAGHANDAGWLLKEMLRVDNMLQGVLDWMEDRDDTLLVVTADHESGGFGFSYSRAGVPTESRPLPGEAFSEDGYLPNFNFGSLELLDRLAGQTKALSDLYRDFENGAVQTDARLAEVIAEGTGFAFSEQAAARVRDNEPHRFRVEGHDYLDRETWPAFRDYEPFYTTYDLGRSQLIAKELAEHQNIVWSTGTHSSSPVALFAVGPENARRRFDGFIHHVQIGERLKAAVRRASRSPSAE